jgi:hypothetical protein
MQRPDNGSVSIIPGAGPDAIPAERATFDAMVNFQSGKAESPVLGQKGKERKKERKKSGRWRI